MNILSYVILIGSVLAISVADVLIKKAGLGSVTFGAVFRSPWFIAAALLYLVQVLGFGYLMFSGARLSWIGIVQTILYALIVVGSGVLLFHEPISPVQGIGIALAISGLVLLNL